MDRLEIMETLKHLPLAVDAEIAGLSEPVLRFRPGDGEWSIKETIGHLAGAATVQHRRFTSVWSLNDPVFVDYDGAADVRESNFQDADLATLLQTLQTERLATVEVLMHAVDWTRLGQQPGVGRRTLKQFAERAIAHDETHLSWIRALKASQSAASRPV